MLYSAAILFVIIPAFPEAAFELFGGGMPSIPFRDGVTLSACCLAAAIIGHAVLKLYRPGRWDGIMFRRTVIGIPILFLLAMLLSLTLNKSGVDTLALHSFIDRKAVPVLLIGTFTLTGILVGGLFLTIHRHPANRMARYMQVEDYSRTIDLADGLSPAQRDGMVILNLAVAHAQLQNFDEAKRLLATAADAPLPKYFDKDSFGPALKETEQRIAALEHGTTPHEG